MYKIAFKKISHSGNNLFQIKFHNAAQAEEVLAEIEERHKEMLNLEKSLVALHGIFVDMATLVADQVTKQLFVNQNKNKILFKQGEKINLIEEHVLKSVDYCAKAVKETKKASVYVKSRRKVHVHYYVKLRKQSKLIFSQKIVIMTVLIVIFLAIIIGFGVGFSQR